MYTLVGILSVIATIVWALVALQHAGPHGQRANPLSWFRHRYWRRQYAIHPLFRLEDPMDVAAVLLLGTVKCEGEISREQKQTIIDIYMKTFRLKRDTAEDLLLASSHLIRNQVYLLDCLEPLLYSSRERFSQGQAVSLLALMTRVATLESPLNEEQRKLIAATERWFEQLFNAQQQDAQLSS